LDHSCELRLVIYRKKIKNDMLQNCKLTISSESTIMISKIQSAIQNLVKAETMT